MSKMANGKTRGTSIEVSTVDRGETAALSPYARKYRVVRSWPGVADGQLVPLHPDRAKRLLAGGLVVEVPEER